MDFCQQTLHQKTTELKTIQEDKLNPEVMTKIQLTGNIGDVHQLLSPKLCERNLLRLVYLGFFTGMPLLRTVDDGQAEPLGIHGCHKTEEEPLFRFSMTFTAPGIWHVPFELLDLLDLIPHIRN